MIIVGDRDECVSKAKSKKSGGIYYHYNLSAFGATPVGAALMRRPC